MRRLLERPHAARFFEAVRRLERHAAATGRAPIGFDADPATESVRLRGHASLAFPAGEIREARGLDGEGRPELVATFLGFLGALGVLPQHYTVLAAARVHRHRDTALVDFLDLLLHRTLSFGWRAWVKHRPLRSFEQAALRPGRRDATTVALRALAGVATGGLVDRQALPDAALLFAGGLFASPVRSAAGLAGAAATWLRHPVRVRQLVPRWLPIEPDDRNRLASRARPGGVHARLGASLFLGERVRDVSSAIRLVVGPVAGSSYRALLPGTRGHRALRELVRTYAGAGIDAQLELVLEREGLPRARLAARAAGGSELGRDSWLGEPARARRERNEIFPLTRG